MTNPHVVTLLLINSRY